MAKKRSTKPVTAKAETKAKENPEVKENKMEEKITAKVENKVEEKVNAKAETETTEDVVEKKTKTTRKTRAKKTEDVEKVEVKEKDEAVEKVEKTTKKIEAFEDNRILQPHQKFAKEISKSDTYLIYHRNTLIYNSGSNMTLDIRPNYFTVGIAKFGYAGITVKHV